MSFPDIRNPREVRSLMHSAYARYVQGETLFPRIRVTEPELFSRKSIDIAHALFRAWAVIDEDNHYFDDSLVGTVDLLTAKEEPQVGIIFATVGRNAVNFAFISTAGEDMPPKIVHGTQDRASFSRQIDGEIYLLSDGREVHFLNGKLQSTPTNPDAVVVRRSNASSIFIAQNTPEVAI